MPIRLRKKGLIFALDGAIAVTVVVLMVVNSVYYFSVASKSSLSHLQSANIADDIMTIYDHLGNFDAIVLNNTKSQFWMNYEIMAKQLNLSRFLPSNYQMWVSVSDLKETPLGTIVSGQPQGHCSGLWQDFFTAPLERNNMTAFLELNLTGSGLLEIDVNGKYQNFGPPTNSTFFLGPFTFLKGVNKVSLRGDAVCIYWFRVVGSEAYAGSTNETMVQNNLFPTDRFVGSGERVFTFKKPLPLDPIDRPIEGTHIIKYRIWVKGGTQ